MEADNWTDAETEAVESSARELADEAKDVSLDSSLDDSRECLTPAKGYYVQHYASSSEESEYSDQMYIDTDVDETSTDSSERSDFEISPLRTPRSSNVFSPEQDIVDATTRNNNILLSIRERWKASETARAYRKTRRETNTFAVFDECLEQVENESVGLRNLFLEVLGKFDLENKRQMVTHLARDCLYPQRFLVVEDYLRSAYHSFPVQVDVTSSPEQDVKESSRGESADKGESSRKKRKIDSEVSTKGSEREELEVVQDKEKSEEAVLESTKGDVEETSQGESKGISTGKIKRRKLDFGVSINASNMEELKEGEGVEKLAEIAMENTKGVGTGSSLQIGLEDGCTGKRRCENTEGEVTIPTVTLSNTSCVPSEHYVNDLTGTNVEILHKIMSREDTQLRKLELTCDFLLISAKCVAFVVAQALNTRALCPLLLKMAGTGVGRDNSKYIKVSMVLVTFYTGLAVEALEAAVQYHRSASSYLAEALEPESVVKVSDKLGEVLSQVIHTSQEVQELDPRRPSVIRKSGAEIRPLVEALACILSPALRQVKEANAFTKDVVTLDSDRLQRAMEITIKGATYYTLFVIYEMKHALSMLSEVAGSNCCGGIGLVEAATEQVNVQGENALQVQMEAVAGKETAPQVANTVQDLVDASAMYIISVQGEDPVKVRVEAVAAHGNASQGKNTTLDHVEAAARHGSCPQGDNVERQMEVAANDESSPQVEITEQGQRAVTAVHRTVHQGENTVQEGAYSVNGNYCQGENITQRELHAVDRHGSVPQCESTKQRQVEVAVLHVNASEDVNTIQDQVETVGSSLQGENAQCQMEVAANHGSSPQVENTEQGQGATTSLHRTTHQGDNTVKVQEETVSVNESDGRNKNTTQGQDDAVTKDGRSVQGENTVEVQMEAAVEHGYAPQCECTAHRQLDAADSHGTVSQRENTVQCEMEVASLSGNASQDVYTIQGQEEAVVRHGCAPQCANSVQILAEADAGLENALQGEKIVHDQLVAAAGHGSHSQVESTLKGQVEAAPEDGSVLQTEKAVQDEVATGHSSLHVDDSVQAQVEAPARHRSVLEGENSVPVVVETAAGLGSAPKGENSVHKVERSLQGQVEVAVGSAPQVENTVQSQVETSARNVRAPQVENTVQGVAPPADVSDRGDGSANTLLRS